MKLPAAWVVCHSCGQVFWDRERHSGRGSGNRALYCSTKCRCRRNALKQTRALDGVTLLVRCLRCDRWTLRTQMLRAVRRSVYCATCRPIAAIENNKARVQANPAQRRESQAQWGARRREYVNERSRQRRKDRPAIYRAITRRWKALHRDQVLSAGRHYKAKKELAEFVSMVDVRPLVEARVALAALRGEIVKLRTSE